MLIEPRYVRLSRRNYFTTQSHSFALFVNCFSTLSLARLRPFTLRSYEWLDDQVHESEFQQRARRFCCPLRWASFGELCGWLMVPMWLLPSSPTYMVHSYAVAIQQSSKPKNNSSVRRHEQGVYTDPRKTRRWHFSTWASYVGTTDAGH